MWISGMNRPDFRTINRLGSETMKGVVEEVFPEVTMLLVELGHVKLEDYFVDGTKIEANADRYVRLAQGWRVYGSEACSACELRPQCTKAKGNRQIRVSFRFRELKARAKANLCSGKGVRLSSRRMVEPETNLEPERGGHGRQGARSLGSGCVCPATLN
jgi:hypothetical protein